MLLKLGVQSLDEVPENFRSLCSEEEGVVTLDTDKLKTEADVTAMGRAKENEKAAHAATKKQLAEAQGKLKAIEEKYGSYDDALDAYDELETLRQNGGTNKDELINERKARKAAEKERDTYKTQLDAKNERMTYLEKMEVNAKKDAKFKEYLESLDGKYDREKARTILDDYREKFNLDECGDIAPIGDKSFADFMTSRLDLYGAYSKSIPGGSAPGSAPLGNGGNGGDFIDEMASGLH